MTNDELLEPTRKLNVAFTYLSCPPKHFEKEIRGSLTKREVEDANVNGVLFVSAAERDEMVRQLYETPKRGNVTAALTSCATTVVSFVASALMLSRRS
jgi:mannitol-specific phosphotransferase system IIBC component